MSAAAFVLAINIFVGGLFATAFTIVAAHRRASAGAPWLAFAYALAIVDGALEFILPFQTDPHLVAYTIFATFLAVTLLILVGLARHYGQTPPWRSIALLAGLALVANAAALDMPRTSLLRNIIYQTPYAMALLLAIVVILRLPHRRALDIALMLLLGLGACNFMGKPFLATWLGSGASPQAYLSSSYAAYSQAMGAVLVISTGLLILLVIVRDLMADITARSETDTLSDLFNRRGFDEHADVALSHATRSGIPAVMVVADLDHFKQINDTYGHAAGDQVIAAFARVMKNSADDRTILGRLGGEEFAALIPGANLATGQLYAETARSAFATLRLDQLEITRGPSASFGVALFKQGDSLSDLLRRADSALYQSKTAGRDRVSISGPEPSLRPAGRQGSKKAR